MKPLIAIVAISTASLLIGQTVLAQRGGAAPAAVPGGGVPAGQATTQGGGGALPGSRVPAQLGIGINSAIQLSGAGVPAGQATSQQFGGNSPAMMTNNGFVPMRGANPTTGTGFGSVQGAFVGVGTPAATAGTAPSADGASRIPGSAAVANGFGPANFRANVGQNGPGRAGNLPPRGGSQNGNSTFQGSTSPFAQNSFLGIMSSLPPSVFSPNVAMPTPPGRASRPQNPSYYPLYLPDGSINQNVGPNAPMANGQVIGGDAAALTQAAQQNATRNGMIFQNGQWWAQSPTGNWEYYRGTTWNSLSPGAIKTPGVSTSSPTPSASASTTTTYTYDVPAYNP